MLIGVPAEIKNHEYRVGLTPASVRELVADGHRVLVQHNAGHAIGFTNPLYEAAGATMVAQADEIFATAEMVVKVKEPQPQEYRQLREGQVLFTYLHLAPDPEQTRGLMESGAVAIAYETVTGPGGGLPLLAPMSEVAGRLSIQAGAHALEMHQGGCGQLLGGVPGVPPARVTIIGGGVVGTHAARMAVGLGADVTVLDRSAKRLRELDDLFQGRIKTLYATRDTLDDSIIDADLVIGAVLIPGASAPRLVTLDMVARMNPGAVLVDVAIDQGGCFETSKPTTHDNPTYIIDGVVHYCVANMPGAVARTATLALNNATLPHVLALANKGWMRALADDPHLRAGLSVCQGAVTCEPVASAQKLCYSPAEKLIAA